MVGTRSKTATTPQEESKGGDDCEGTQSDIEVVTRTRSIDMASSSPLRRSNRSTKTSLERLPRPISSGGGSSDATHSKAGERPSLRSGAGLRSSSRTSLERLPLPQPPAVASPVRDGDRVGTRASARGKGIAGGRTNAELNALLGLDAANQRLGWPARVESVDFSCSDVEEEDGEEEEDDDEEEQGVQVSYGRRLVRKAGGNGSVASPGKSSKRGGGKVHGSRADSDEAASASGTVAAPMTAATAEEEGDRPKYGFRDRRTLKRTKFFTYDKEGESDDHTEEEDEEEEEEEEEVEGEGEGEVNRDTRKRKQRRYKLRKREVTRRQVVNITAEERLPRRKTRKVIPYDMASQRVSIRRRKRSSNAGSGESSRRRHGHHGVRRSHFDSSSESSDGGAGFADHDRGFDRYQRKTHERELSSIRPINSSGFSNGSGGQGGGGQGSIVDKASARDLLRADVSPMEIDPNITFDSIGGGKKHVRMLKEMVMLPLVYPELFEGFGAPPPKGVLFYGPPGTGKTLTARALANACSKSGHRISFFMRKGADCLSKWVGEAERQLRLLFEQARRHQPSIIFFDEIDGLAPVRSVKQDQIHASVVSTLLALMDGLDSRGQVIVIGATNRPDSLDPALRRPGRFDRELAFPLPTLKARREILRVHTREWQPPMDPKLEDELAERTAGFCGADMKALCAEATLLAVRRRYPQIYASEEKLLLDVSSVKVTRSHFLGALRSLTPSSQREGINPARPLPAHLSPLLSDSFAAMSETLKVQFPHVSHGKNLEGVSDDDDDDDDDDGSGADPDKDLESDDEGCATGAVAPATVFSPQGVTLEGGGTERLGNGVFVSGGNSNGGGSRRSSSVNNSSSSSSSVSPLRGVGGDVTGVGSTWVHRPRLALYGLPGCGQTQLAAAALHALDGIPVHSLALHSLHGDTSRTAEAALVSRFVEARRNVPSVLYLPGAHQWWDGEDAAVHPHLRTLLINLLNDIPDTWPILVVSTWDMRLDDDSGATADADKMLSDSEMWSSGNVGRGLSSSSPPHGTASRKQLINALLGSCSDEAPWAQVRYAPAGAASVNGVAIGGSQGRFGWNGAIEMCRSKVEQRRRFAEEVLSTLTATLMKAFSGRGTGARRKAKKAPPPPLPLAPQPPVRQELVEEPEDESLRKQDEHYLRELRICIREVLSDLRKDRRFSMFKQIGDYVGEYMDLNGIREKLNAEEYLTLDDFEEDLKLMAREAKEVRDRLKADLARAEANAAAVGAASAPVTRSSSSGDTDVAAGAAGAAAGVGPGAAVAGGGGEVERRALMEVDRLTAQEARAASAVDLACFLRDAALSFLQDCVSRLGYDLEGKCKKIAARVKRGGRKVVGDDGGRRDGVATGKQAGRGAPAEASGHPTPNYTSESVTDDIYSRFAGQGGPRERNTRASKRSTSSDGRLVQLGDNGRLLEQGTEVELLQPPRKRSQRQRSPVKRKVGFADHDTGEADEQRTMKGGPGLKESSEAGVSPVAVVAKSSGSEPCNATAVDDKVGTSSQDGAAVAVAAGPQQARASRSGDPGDVPLPAAEKSLSREGVSPVQVSSETVDGGSATAAETASASKPLANGSFHLDVSSDFPNGIVANGERPGCRVKHGTAVPFGDDIDDDDDSPMSDVSSGVRMQQEATAPLSDGVDNENGPLTVDTMFGSTTESRSVPGPAGRESAKSVPGVGEALSGTAATLLEQSKLPPSGGWLDANDSPLSASVDLGPGTRLREEGSARGKNEKMSAGGRGKEGVEAMECDTVVVANGGQTALTAGAEKLTTEKAATSSSSEATEAVEAGRAADLAAKRRAKVDARLEKKMCEQECLRLLEARDHIARSTQGWSVEQLLALRGSVLELGAALCGRGRSGVSASSISEAVDILVGYFKRRLP